MRSVKCGVRKKVRPNSGVLFRQFAALLLRTPHLTLRTRLALVLADLFFAFFDAVAQALQHRADFIQHAESVGIGLTAHFLAVADRALVDFRAGVLRLLGNHVLGDELLGVLLGIGDDALGLAARVFDDAVGMRARVLNRAVGAGTRVADQGLRFGLRIADQALRFGLGARHHAFRIFFDAVSLFDVFGQRFFKFRGLNEKSLFVNDNFAEYVVLSVIYKLFEFV